VEAKQMKVWMRALLTLAVVVAAGNVARAQSAACRVLEVELKPVPHLQLAVWLEDEQGHFIDTAFVTRSVGALGLANRPGNSMLKSAFRWPYGRRDMTLPVWAHARGKTYQFIVMGGAAGTDSHDNTIGYHEGYSSTENFYCPPSSLPLDAISCASQFTGSKGVFDPSRKSFYPPRADLKTFGSFDSADAHSFASLNDVAAVSGATPPGNVLLNPDIRWAVPSSMANGKYVVKVEASLEADFNSANMHPSFPDANAELRVYGSDAIGQPSVVYAVPITVDGTPQTATTDGYAGYGTWDGSDGALHRPDPSIADAPGSGAGRLAHVTDADGTWRVHVFANGCSGCRTPQAVTSMSATPADTTIRLDFAAPSSTDELDKPRSYEIRYQPKVPLTDDTFHQGIPAEMPPPPGAPHAPQEATISGLKATTLYYVGIRAINACGQPGPAAFASATTQQQKFVVLHGCFVATAAYGSQMEPAVAALRQFRDGALLTSPLGRLFVAAYYAFSPPLARLIASDERLRAGARGVLSPVVALAHSWLLSEHSAR
jgi:hypothetical protein